MRDLFPEYYPLTDDQVTQCVTAGTIVLDTNVLLGLYRFSTSEREGLLDLLGRVQDRLWIPYQVAAEYQRGRETVVVNQAGYYNRVVSLVSGPNADEVKAKLAGLTLPEEVRPSIEDLVEDYLTAMVDASADFVSKAESIRAEHVVTGEQARRDDPVRARLDEFFSGRVGTAPDPKTYEERVKEALVRYADKIPPGYKDQDKDTDERKAGDYLLWAELLEHTAGFVGDDSVLLVTNDTKEDWFRKDGQPLEALRREFADHSPATYHQVSLKGFLSLANQHLSAEVPEATIERASTIQLAGELRGKTVDFHFGGPEYKTVWAELNDRYKSWSQSGPEADRIRHYLQTLANESDHNNYFTQDQWATLAADRARNQPNNAALLAFLRELAAQSPSDKPVEYWPDDDGARERDDSAERDDQAERDDRDD